MRENAFIFGIQAFGQGQGQMASEGAAVLQFFMPPPLGAGGIMFPGCPSVRASVRPSVRPSVIPSVTQNIRVFG